MGLRLRFFAADNRAQLVELVQPALAACLGFFVSFVNCPIGELPRDHNHTDAMLLLKLVKHVAHLLTAEMSAADSQQTVTLVQHRLNDLQPVSRLCLGEPNQTTPSAVDG